jgi:tetratricopeptide (TPR) repeat protein
MSPEDRPDDPSVKDYSGEAAEQDQAPSVGAGPNEPAIPPEPAEEDVEKAEQELRQASVLRIRGMETKALDCLDEALRLAGGSATVQEAVGDEYKLMGRSRASYAAYKMAFRINPKNPRIEDKFAEMHFQTTEALAAGLSGTSSTVLMMADAKRAAVFSLFVPGLGQLTLGDRRRGLTMLITFIVALVWLIVTPDGISGLLRLVFASAGSSEFNGVVLVPLFLLFAVYLWSIGDAKGKADKVKAEKVQRPVPPVDKSFEL